MMSKTRCALFAGAVSAVVAGSASASLITMTFTGNAYFVFDNLSVIAADYSIVATGDTDNRFQVSSSGGDAWGISNDSAVLTIAGWGSEQILTPTTTAWNIPYRAAGLVSSNFSQLAVSTDFDVLPAWDMLTSVSTGTSEGSSGNMWLSTARGMVVLNISHSVAFSAVVAPAPGAAACLGLVFAVGARRRRA